MAHRQIHSQEQFRLRIMHESRRAERGNKPALLILFDGLQTSQNARDCFVNVLSASFRETDVFGWLVTDTTLGVIFLELGNSGIEAARDSILNKIAKDVFSSANQLGLQITIATHFLPPYTEVGKMNDNDLKSAETLWRCVFRRDRVLPAIKRALDICGSSLLLMVLFPVLLAITVGIRITSRGPVFFHQARAGLRSRTFELYKFRSMEAGSDDDLHQEYVRRFINGNAEQHLDDCGRPVYKLTHDPRVTRFGKFLRRTSLDELPQLWNVLRGDMSLVGPRPPLPYEVECYELWHRRRVYELKPGLTGLWQVRGRNRCCFDEMIRMDLQHGRKDSLALYFKVLLETPYAVINGDGAH